MRILGPAGKAKGRYKNCWNMQYEKPLHLAGSLGNIDFSTDMSSQECVGKVNGTTDKTVANQVFVSDSSNSKELFKTAKLKELESWKNWGVYMEVQNAGQPLMSTRWVLSMRQNDDSSFNLKARLAVRGFEEDKLPKYETQLAVVARELVKVFISVASLHNWIPH